MSVGLLVLLLPFWNQALLWIYPVLNEIASWIFWKIPLAWLYNSPSFSEFCMSLSLLVGQLHIWNYAKVDILLGQHRIFFMKCWTLWILGLMLSTWQISHFLIIFNLFFVFLGVSFWDPWSCFDIIRKFVIISS